MPKGFVTFATLISPSYAFWVSWLIHLMGSIAVVSGINPNILLTFLLIFFAVLMNGGTNGRDSTEIVAMMSS